MSQIDIPHESLDPKVWDVSVDPPHLKSEARDFMMSTLFDTLDRHDVRDWRSWLRQYYLAGSIVTNQYRRDTDIDIGLDVEWGAFLAANAHLDLLDDQAAYFLLRDLAARLDEIMLPGTDHDFTFYVAGSGKLLESDFRYDLFEDRWFDPPPELVSLGLVPDITFAPIKREVEKVCVEIDHALGILKRSVIDWVRMDDYLQEAGPSATAQLDSLPAVKLDAIKRLVDGLASTFDRMERMRSGIFEIPPDDDRHIYMHYDHSRLWTDKNIAFKYFEKYSYVNMLVGLREIRDAGFRPDSVRRVRQIVASILDYPHTYLDRHIWELEGEPPKMKQDVRRTILDRLRNVLEKAGYEDHADWIKRIYLLGSEATYQYRQISDLDVTTIIDDVAFADAHPEHLGRENVMRVFRKISREISGEVLSGTLHPINYYFTLSDAVMDSDAIYDIVSEEWIKPPGVFPADWDPEEEFAEYREQALEAMQRIDDLFAETKRDLIDHEILEEIMAEMESPARRHLVERLHRKMDEVEQDIEELVEEYNELHEERMEAFVQGDETGLVSLQLSRSWAPANIKWKYIERYRYLNLFSKLREILEDGVVPAEIPQLREILL